VSPRVALNYRLHPGHTLRASVSRANRTPVLLEQQADELFQIGPRLDRVMFAPAACVPNTSKRWSWATLASGSTAS
jgi:TonB dependent receptor